MHTTDGMRSLVLSSCTLPAAYEISLHPPSIDMRCLDVRSCYPIYLGRCNSNSGNLLVLMFILLQNLLICGRDPVAGIGHGLHHRWAFAEDQIDVF